MNNKRESKDENGILLDSVPVGYTDSFVVINRNHSTVGIQTGNPNDEIPQKDIDFL